MNIGIGIPEQIIGFDAGVLSSCCTSGRRGEHQPRLDRPVPIWRGSRRMKASTCSYHHGPEVLA